uniref:G-protein coupled receptors family 1 profile domain-containing protein n=1 Tax=Meloidogyne enterolobii TaxID=390850 RepID=A0A6V7TZR5_MELEN|nr:unnamed protein product [Meloidogyne enterolobii]CAD2196223.1 unnamed protein product [Meloidogyne enterolobii]
MGFLGGLLLGYPLNIILIILIIFKTPKEMETHSRILIQNCVLDILFLTLQMFMQVFYISDKNGNTIFIITDGILIYFMKETFNTLLFYYMNLFYIFIFNLNTNGLCVQFIYRYLILNRNMKIGVRRYLYMFSIAVIINVFYILDDIFAVIPYSNGGFQQFVDDNFNKILPYIQCKTIDMGMASIVLLSFIEIIPYFIIIICGIKMVKYVNSHAGFDQEMKRLLKQLTKTLIILAVVPFVKHAASLLIILFIETNNNMANIIRLIIYHWFHFTPVFNAVVCILTNKPYRTAFLKSIRIVPQ